MQRNWIRNVSCPIVAMLLAAGIAATAPALADFDERFELRADTLVMRNLIGEVIVEGHDGGSFAVEVRARGRDVTKESLRLDVREGSHAELDVRFPLDESTRFVYPALGPGSRTSFRADEQDDEGLSGFLGWLFGGSGRVRVSGRGTGLEMWADLTVRVPRGGSLHVHHGAGRIYARSVEGDVELDIHSGRVEADDVRGSLGVDTGSGSVRVEDVRGDVNVDTGSGSVRLARIEGGEVLVDTGSGSIRFEELRADTVHMDTGSGGVSGGGLSAERAEVDTGSGSVSLSFDRVGNGRFSIDTGSGSIRLGLPADTSARIRAETGSGGIDVDFDGAEVHREGRNDARIVIGGGDADFDLDTGSGSIRIQHR